ncbi:MAG: hypothetical protein H7124_02495 [Phycisphaerales bacterium]|nr:hypothetical protein [Hyphomonadaceae bacterium]
MKASPWAAFTALFLAALCAFAPGLASAQSAASGNVYAVSGVYVDETANNASAAQQAGFTAAYRIGFDRLVRRLTAPAELAARGMPAPQGPAFDLLVLSVDVEEERRSSTRYIGRLTVRFNAETVGAMLRQQGLTVIDARTSPFLVAPISAPGTAEETAALWREVWTQGGFGNELAPLRIAAAELQGAPAWDSAAPFAQQNATASALYATLRVQGSTATAQLVEVNASTRRDRGEVSVRIQGTDPAALRAALAVLADQANAQLQNEWKARATTGGSERGRISASALYTDQRQWEQIKDALEAAAQSVVSEIRIEAVGRQGALVSFSFVGNESQLAAELSRRGVRLDSTANGPTLRVAGR